MSVRVKLAGFAAILAASLFAGLALGAVTGSPSNPARSTPAPSHQVHQP